MKRVLPLVLLLLASALAAQPPAAQPSQAPPGSSVKLPDSPVGRQFQAWLQVIEAADENRLRQYIQQNFTPGFLAQVPLEEHMKINLNFARKSGGLTLLRMVEAEPTELVVRAQPKNGGPELQVQFMVAAEPPHGVDGISISPASPGGAASTPVPKPAGPMSEQEIVQELGRWLQQETAAGRFSGTVLLAKDGKPLFHQAYGLANREAGTANDLETKYNLGSMNKMFTAVSIGQLAERGRLKYDDAIGKHLPDYPNKEVAQKVTIHHLLTHTSGMGSYFKPEFFQAQVEKLDDYLPHFASDPLAFEPGQGSRYSNAAFIVLGMIVEKLSGQDYFTYVRRHIFEPAGMKNTDSYPREEKTANRAVGYTRGQSGSGEPKANTGMLPWKGGPAGGGYSTVGDMLRFAQALQGGKLVKPETLRTLTSSKASFGGPGRSYGYGFGLRELKGERIFGHGGGAPGINGDLEIYAESGYVAASLANLDPFAAERVTEWLRYRLPTVKAAAQQKSE